MNYQQFRTHFLPFEVISLKEIRKWQPEFDQRRLVEWQEKGYLTRIIRGWYHLNEKKLDLQSFFSIANAVYNPSYISLESALSYYGLIPEGVHLITSVSTKKTASFTTEIASFSYQSFAKKYFFGYRLETMANKVFKIATLEKSLLDYCYFHSELDLPEARDELRLNHDQLLENIDEELLNNYLNRWNSPTLTKRVKLLLDTIKIKDKAHA